MKSFATVFALTLLVAVSLAGPVRADDTELNEGSYGPEPVGGGFTGPESAIAMTSERLTINFGRTTSDVATRFVFRNTLKGVTAKQLVGFPDEGAAEAEATRRDPKNLHPWHPEIPVSGPLMHMQTLVDGHVTPSYLKYGFVSWGDSTWKASDPAHGYLMAWHTLPISFPAGKDVIVERRYSVKDGDNVLGQKLFEYIVHTGGVWHGPIHRLEADITLKDGLTVKDLFWDTKNVDGRSSVPPRGQWQVISPTRLKLVWTEFEPRTDKTKGSFSLATWPRIDSQGKPLKRHPSS